MNIIFITRSLKYCVKLQKKINNFESNRAWMYMDEFVNCMILRVFI